MILRNLTIGAAVAVLALTLGAADAAAQFRLSVGGGPSFGISMPVDEHGDEVSTGYNAQVSVGLSVPLLPVALRADGMLNQFPVSGEDHSFRSLSASLNGVLSIPSIGITPYLIGGLGFYRTQFTEDEHGHAGDTVTNMGINVGAGVRVGLPGLSVFGEARLHNVFADDAVRFAPLTVGVSF
jgi:hypothetical protein